MADFKNIDTLKTTLDRHQPLPEPLVKGLRQDFFIRNTYHSNGIEGNTLTIYETKAVLEDGVTISGKSLREHYEATNHKEALEFVENIVNDNTSLDERTIKDIHSTILHGIDNAIAGKYRNHEVMISAASHRPPTSFQVPAEMENLIDWYTTNAKDLHTVERAAMLHSKFVNIHPFADGNGRTSRLLLNFELMKDGYPPITIEKDDRFDYYNVLDEAGKNQNYEPFINFVAQLAEKSLNHYVSFINRQQSENTQLSLNLDGLDTSQSEFNQ